MNTFLALTSGSSIHDPFLSLHVNIEVALHESRRDFTDLASFLGKSSLQSEDVMMFINQLKRFITSTSALDSDVAIIRYDNKLFYVCCPHLEEQESPASYFINGFNCLPEYVLEGTGFEY